MSTFQYSPDSETFKACLISLLHMKILVSEKGLKM